MDSNSSPSVISDGTACIAVEPTRVIPGLAEDVRAGLLGKPRSLPPKYFYDARGSQLFEQICSTPEYYPTRTEDTLLQHYAKDIIEHTRPEQILEFGSGNAQKTRRLFDACEQLDHQCDYAPFEYCLEILEETAEQLYKGYDWLTVSPLLGDYHAGLDNLPDYAGSRLFVFLGSTIGNFTPAAAARFLDEIRMCMDSGDYLLLGVDRIKDSNVLDEAYNDDQGLTAEFNLNVLRVINRELNANFMLDGFDHDANFNQELERIEMRLIANQHQKVKIGKIDETIDFIPGDTILTEISQKYSFEGIESLLDKCHLKIKQHYESTNQYFSLLLASA